MYYTQHLNEYSGPPWCLVYSHFTDEERQVEEGGEESHDLDSQS